MLSAMLWFAAGALVVMFTPPKYEDVLRQFVIAQWTKFMARK